MSSNKKKVRRHPTRSLTLTLTLTLKLTQTHSNSLTHSFAHSFISLTHSALSLSHLKKVKCPSGTQLVQKKKNPCDFLHTVLGNEAPLAQTGLVNQLTVVSIMYFLLWIINVAFISNYIDCESLNYFMSVLQSSQGFGEEDGAFWSWIQPHNEGRYWQFSPNHIRQHHRLPKTA